MPATFDPVLKHDLGEVVYQRIRTALMQSRLKPNDRLVIRKLADDLGLSLTPVREALLRLVSENVLVLGSRNTATVPELDYDTFVSIYDLRADLESKAAVQAIPHLSKAIIDDLEKNHLDMIEAQVEGKLESARELNAIFHEKYCNCSHSPILISFISTLWMRCGPIMAHIHRNGPQKWENDVHPHTILLEGFRQKDADKVTRAVRYDILHGGKELLAYIKEQAGSASGAEKGSSLFNATI